MSNDRIVLCGSNPTVQSKTLSAGGATAVSLDFVSYPGSVPTPFGAQPAAPTHLLGGLAYGAMGDRAAAAEAAMKQVNVDKLRRNLAGQQPAQQRRRRRPFGTRRSLSSQPHLHTIVANAFGASGVAIGLTAAAVQARADTDISRESFFMNILSLHAHPETEPQRAAALLAAAIEEYQYAHVQGLPELGNGEGRNHLEGVLVAVA